MAFRDEQADILGGPILQRPESGLFATFPQYQLAFKSVTLLGLGLLMWIVCVRGLEHLKKHRELRYRKAMRRKHGIPDSDCRPFAVAYAAAKRAHLEREAQDRKKTTNYVSGHNLLAVHQRSDVQNNAIGPRRRIPETTVQLHDYQHPGKHALSNEDKYPEQRPLAVGRYNPSPHWVNVSKVPVGRPSARHASRKDCVTNIDKSQESRKRSFDHETDVEHETTKKSRVDGSEFVDSDEPMDWYAQYADLPSVRIPEDTVDQQTGANHSVMSGQGESKLNSFIYLDSHELADEAMEDADEDEVTELKAVARGKKRDRAEAGSTLGGDDDDDIRNGRESCHRKRRTILQGKIEVLTRGQKRDREAESPESEDEGADSETSRRQLRRGSKKKKGKNTASKEPSETPSEDSCITGNPLFDGRRVGDEWEADGIQYKVGARGERLRLTLVKKARNKYHMPQDSQHPDRSVALEIYMETWMTDEQYKEAEARRELAWQEAPKESSGAIQGIPESPVKSGKSLLWDSVKGSPTRRPFRQLVSAGISTHTNPLVRGQLQPTQSRRVASSSTIHSPIPLRVTDSPTRPGFRGFSKWEKQDREAEALARIRAKVEEQKKTQGPHEKLVEVTTSATAPELGTKSLPVPTIMFTPAPVVASEGDPGSSILQSKLNTSTAASPGISDSNKVPVAIPTISSSSSRSIASGTPPLFPSASTAPTTTSSVSPFTFAKAPQTLSSTSTVASLSTSTSLPPTLGATAKLQPPSLENASQSFVFTKPESPSGFLPAAPAKSQTLSFSATLNPLPSVAFGSSATAKAEVQASPSVSSPATVSENLKPTAPLFSFSGTSLSPNATGPPLSSAVKSPFGQPSTTATSTLGSNTTLEFSSQPKPTFKFGRTPVDGDSISKSPVLDDSKKSATPVPVFGAVTTLNEPIKSLPSMTTSSFGKPAILASTTGTFGKPVTTDGGLSTSNPTKTTLESTNTAVFSFGGANTGFKFTEEPKSVSSTEGTTGEGVNSMSSFGNTSVEKKPTFSFSASTEGPKSTFDGNAEGLKHPSVFGSSASSLKPTSAFVGIEMSKPSIFSGSPGGSKSTFTFGSTAEPKPASNPTSESSKTLNAVDAAKPSSAVGATPLTSPSPFTFGKDDTTAKTSTSTSTQSQPIASFTFGTPVNSVFPQPSTPAPIGESIFGKPTGAPLGAFGPGGTTPNTFTFGKSAAQNQKQEQ